MNVLLPLTMPPGHTDDIVLLCKGLGFQPLSPAYDFPTLTKFLRGDDGGQITNAGETAIPNVAAHIIYLRQKLGAPALDFNDAAIRAWIGVLAIIALNETKGFKVYTCLVPLTGDKGDKMLTVYHDALAKVGMLNAKGEAEILFMNGVPLAIMSPNPNDCYCVPFSTIDSTNHELASVPWFAEGSVIEEDGVKKPVSHRWQSVFDLDGMGVPYLNTVERAEFAQWLDAVKSCVHNPQVSNMISQVMLKLESDIVQQNPNASLITLETTFNFAGARPENLLAWQGALACLALSNMMGLEISLEPIPLISVNRFPYFRRFGKVFGDIWIMVRVNGVRVGVLSKDFIIYPLYHVTGNLTNVPWFKNGVWCPISSIPENEMKSAQKRRLAHWLIQVSNAGIWDGTSKVTTKLNEFALTLGKPLGGNTTPSYTLNMATPLPNGMPVPAEYAPMLSIFQQVPDLAVTLPPDNDIFTEHLVLTMADKTFNPGGYHNQLGLYDGANVNCSIKIQDDSNPIMPVVETFHALMPLKSNFTEGFLASPLQDVVLGGMTLCFNQSTKKIIVNLVLLDGGMPVSKAREYDMSQVIFYSDMPYSSMWPYIRVADTAGQSLWKQYFVTWNPSLPYHSESSIFGQMTPPALNPVQHGEAVETMDHKEIWGVLTYDKFPEYIHLQYIDAGTPIEVGCIYIQPPRPHVINTSYLAAIDFGTANTIIRLADNQGNVLQHNENGVFKPDYVFTNRYVQPLVMGLDAMAMATGKYDPMQDAQVGFIRDFHEFSWLPYFGRKDNFWFKTGERDTDRIPTVVHQYADANAVQTDAPRYGQLMRTNCNVLSHFLAQNPDLTASGVFSNIKLEKGTNYVSGAIAISSILLECALAAAERNGTLQFIVSYPDSKMWGTISNFWRLALANVSKVCPALIPISSSPTSSNNMLRTTELWAAKHYATEWVGKATPSVGYSILDIGGGTSDISLWKSDDSGFNATEKMKGEMSLRYAGNQLIAETIFEFYRQQKVSAVGKQNFTMLWTLNDPAAGALRKYEADMEAGFKRLLNVPRFTNDAHIEDVHKQVPLLTGTIIADAKFSPGVLGGNPTVQTFCALLRLKLSNVFYILAQYIKLTGACNIADQINTPYRIYLAGGGSAAYDVSNPAIIEPFLVNMLNEIVGNRRYEIETQDSCDRKTEVVTGMCKLVQSKVATGGGDITVVTPHDVLPDDASLTTIQDIPDSELEAEMEKSYRYYVENILKGNDCFTMNGMVNLYDKLTLERSSRGSQNYDLYQAHATNIMQAVYDEVDDSTPNIMKAHIAAIKLIDYLLLIQEL